MPHNLCAQYQSILCLCVYMTYIHPIWEEKHKNVNNGCLVWDYGRRLFLHLFTCMFQLILLRTCVICGVKDIIKYNSFNSGEAQLLPGAFLRRASPPPHPQRHHLWPSYGTNLDSSFQGLLMAPKQSLDSGTTPFAEEGHMAWKTFTQSWARSLIQFSFQEDRPLTKEQLRP